MVTELVTAGAVGVVLGALTGLPLGVVNVAIVEAAARRGVRAASGIAVGGAVADMVHAGLAAGGVAGAIVARPAATATLHVIAGAVLLGYAVALWRSGEPRAGSERETPPTFARGVLAGLAFTLPNPAALGAWIAVAAALAPPSVAAGLVGAAGVGVGSAAWFLLLAKLAASGAARRGSPRRRLTRAVAIVLAALGAAAVARAAL